MKPTMIAKKTIVKICRVKGDKNRKDALNHHACSETMRVR